MSTEVLVALALLTSPSPPPRAPAPSVVQTSVIGHSHRCPNGHVWSHTDASFGNRAAHTCPVCGAGPVWGVYQRNVAVTVNRPVSRTPVPAAPGGWSRPSGVTHLPCPPGQH